MVVVVAGIVVVSSPVLSEQAATVRANPINSAAQSRMKPNYSELSAVLSGRALLHGSRNRIAHFPGRHVGLAGGDIDCAQSGVHRRFDAVESGRGPLDRR